MDCLNAHGQLVGIEDVDDMGGQVCMWCLVIDDEDVDNDDDND